MKILFTLTVLVGVALSVHLVWAQRDAASKIDGAAYEAPYFYSTSQMYRENAWRHAQVLQQAASSGVAVPKAVAREHTDAIRTNLQAAARHHASLSESTKSKPSAAAHLKAIDDHHKKASGLADDIDQATAHGTGDAAKVIELASALSAELKAAGEKHHAAGEHLRSGKPQPPAK